MNRLFVIVCLLLVAHFAVSQAPVRKLSNVINHPSINVTAPFISFDGGSILFTSDYADEGTLVYFSQREGGDWKKPVELPKHLNSRLNFSKGYALSADGKTVYITSAKSGGVGNYDIWSSELKGSTWTEIKNIFPPINTRGNEGCPSFTPDGKTLYFMRCDKMDRDKAEQCKIFVTRKKPNGQWEDPAELPPHINTGNSQTPRIGADSETLIFSSDKLTPNQGGMDLYVTKFKNGEWSEPIPLDVVNTEKDDQFVSTQANGRYLLKDAPGRFKNEAHEFLLPDAVRSQGVMKVEGFVKDADGKPAAAYISVFNLFNNARIYNSRPNTDGSFFFYLIEGQAYELSVEHEQGAYTFYTKIYDLMHNAALRNDKLDIVLKPLAAGDDVFAMDIEQGAFSFDPLKEGSDDLRRITRLMKSTSFNYEVQVLLSGYVEDSVRSSPDLTEVMIDSTHVVLESFDSLGQRTTRDSVVVKTRYHNDRTEKEAQAIIDKLVAAGIDRRNLSMFINARQEDVVENRKTTIKIIARPKP